MSSKPKYGIVLTSIFKKDLKLAQKRGYDLSLLSNIVGTLLPMGNLWLISTKTIA